MATQRSVQRGDTLIEVLFAITVFSLVAVISISIMNKGAAMAQRSLEITLVRQQMDAQADLVRLSHAAYINDMDSTTGPGMIWKNIRDNPVSSGSTLPLDGSGDCQTNVPGSFVIARTAPGATNITIQRFSQVLPASVYSKVDVNRTITRPVAAEGLWMQAVRVRSADTSVNVDAYDVHIRACWDSVGSDVPATLGTIVRLYEPR